MTTAKRKPQKPVHSRASKAPRARKIAPATPRFSEQYERAVKEYEKGLQLVQKKSYTEAQTVLRGLLDTFAEEAEICDRARSYLSVCRERMGPGPSRPATFDDHYHMGVYHLNRNEPSAALKEFDKALVLAPTRDVVHYAMASAHALAGDKPRAVAALQESIRLNEKNRVYAQSDPDFDRIRDEHEFIQIVEPEGAGAH